MDGRAAIKRNHKDSKLLRATRDMKSFKLLYWFLTTPAYVSLQIESVVL